MRLQGHSSAVTGLSVSRSGRWVVSGSQDDTIRVWDLTTAAELTRFSIGVSDINALVLSPDEDRLVAIGQGTKVVTARLSDQKVLSEFDVGNPLHQIAMSADGQRLLLMIQGSPTWAVMACNLDGKRQVALPVNGNIQSIDLSRSGTFAVVADNNNQVFVWDVERGGEPRQLAGNPTYISDLAIAPNEELVAGVSPEAIILWNPVTGEEVNRIRVPRGAQKVAFALDSRRLVASSVARDLTVIDAQLGTVIASFDARASSGSVSVCHSIAVLPDGRGAVTAGYDGTIFVWHLPE
jgi:WD40 repeat protein